MLFPAVRHEGHDAVSGIALASFVFGQRSDVHFIPDLLLLPSVNEWGTMRDTHQNKGKSTISSALRSYRELHSLTTREKNMIKKMIDRMCVFYAFV